MIKDHVTKRAKRINARIPKTYNLSMVDFEQALFGTSEQQRIACQKIGKVGRESQIVLDLLPEVKRHFLNNINATTQYNQTKAELLKTASNSLTTIDRAEMQTMLANQQYNNKRSALAQEFVAGKESERQRHNLEINYIRLKAVVDQALARVDGQAKLIEVSNRPALKQVDENLSYQQKVLRNNLGYGNEERLELMPVKNYETVGTQAKNIVSRIAEKLGLYV